MKKPPFSEGFNYLTINYKKYRYEMNLSNIQLNRKPVAVYMVIT